MRCRTAGPQGPRVSPCLGGNGCCPPTKAVHPGGRDPLRRRYLRGLGRRPGGTRRAAAGLDSPGLGASSAAREGSAGLPRPAPRRSPPSSAFLSRSPAYPGAGGYCRAPLAAAAPPPPAAAAAEPRRRAPRPPPPPPRSRPRDCFKGRAPAQRERCLTSPPRCTHVPAALHHSLGGWLRHEDESQHLHLVMASSPLQSPFSERVRPLIQKILIPPAEFALPLPRAAGIRVAKSWTHQTLSRRKL